MITRIYALCEQDGEIRYIGKTGSSIENRLAHHLLDARRKIKNYRCNWIRSVMSRGYFPIVRLIGEVEGDGILEEIAWIAYGRSEGWRLVNGTDGGENPPSRKGKPSWSKGIHLSQDHCRKLSEAHKGVKLSKEHSLKIGEGHKGQNRSESFCRRISEARKEYWRKRKELGLNNISSKHRRKIKESLKEYWRRRKAS